jgi:predicted nucleic acid-binding protein
VATFTVVYDANVLYPAPLRDLLIRLGQTGLFRARWTDAILDEVFRSILKVRTDLKPENLARTRQMMCEAVRDCLITGYEPLIQALELPDADDRHVLAAAVRCGAQVIVTSNVKDFPEKALTPLAIEAQVPDEFVLNLLDLSPEVVLETIGKQAAGLKKPQTTVDELLGTLEKNGLKKSVAEIRELRRADEGSGR